MIFNTGPVLIGPTFFTELAAAGVSSAGIVALTDLGQLNFADTVSADDQAKALAVLAAHDPTKQLPRTQYTFLEFMALFSPTEQAAIVGSSDIQVRLFLLMASGATMVDFTDPRIPGALDYLTSLSLLASGRKAAILDGVSAN